MTEITIYADDNTLCISAANIGKLVSALEEPSNALSKWLTDNRLKDNTNGCHLLVSGTKKPILKQTISS